MEKKFNATTDFDLTATQTTAIKNRLLQLASEPQFSDVSFYLNNDFVGGRPPKHP